jgi:ATPase subunit of ABC transporter with duplicated ATPase domains
LKTRFDEKRKFLIYELIRSYEGTVISISHNRKYNEILDADVSLDMGTGVVENLKLTKNL